MATKKKSGTKTAHKRRRRSVKKSSSKHSAILSQQQSSISRGTSGSSIGNRSPRGSNFEEWTRDQLYEKARQIGIEGRSLMSKRQLMNALRRG